jgi:hypothetical protein
MTYHVECHEARIRCELCGSIVRTWKQHKSPICSECLTSESARARSLHIPGREVLLCARESNLNVGSGQLCRYDDSIGEFVPSFIVHGQIGTALCSFGVGAVEEEAEEEEDMMYMISSGSLLRLTEMNGVVAEAEDIGPLTTADRRTLSGLRGACRVGGGLLCLAPRGTLSSSDRDCVVWVEVDTAQVHVLLQTESCDAVDMDVRPTGGGSGAPMDLFLWSHSSGLMKLRLLLETCWSGGRRILRCVDLSPMTWVGPADADSRPPPGVVTIT